MLRSWKRPKPKARTPKRFDDLRDATYAHWVRSHHPCLLAGSACEGRVESAHVKTRGSGARDRQNLVPLCLGHHREQHRRGIKTFQRTYGLDLVEIAQALDARYARTHETEEGE